MSSIAQTRDPAVVEAAASVRPRLRFFYDDRSGQSRRAEGFLAQVLQRRRSHDTFRIQRLHHDQHAELARRCGVAETPALVVEEKRVRLRIERPRGCAEIREALAPWLR